MRPPRRLRWLGFELDRCSRIRAEMFAIERELDREEMKLRAVCARGKTIGYLPEETYFTAVNIENVREMIADAFCDIDWRQREIDAEMAEAIENHLGSVRDQRAAG
jgi:hypothetical protein